MSLGAQYATRVLLSLCVAYSADAQSRAQLGMSTPHARVAITTLLTSSTHAQALVTLDIDPGWHVSWRNPGETGVPTRLEWQLPRGVRVTGETWPVPVISHTSVGDTHTLEGAVPWLIDFDVDSGGHAIHTVVLTMRYGACRNVCITEKISGNAIISAASAAREGFITPATRAQLVTDAGVIAARRTSASELCLSRSPLPNGSTPIEVVADSGLGLDAAQPLVLRKGAAIVRFGDVSALRTGSRLLFVRGRTGASARLDLERPAHRCTAR